MLTLEQIREKMADRRVRVVADATGLHHQTIYEVMNEHSNPSYKTVKTLSDYLTQAAA
jgi:DNA-binding phage protein